CASFDVEALIVHMIGSLGRFRATASGEEPQPSGADPDDGADAAAYRRAAGALVEAWREGGVEGRTLHVRIGDFPATWALSQQTADVVVHGWDVAKATGQQPSADPDVALAVLAWARTNLRPEYRGDEDSGKAFGPEVEADDDAPPLDRLVAFFGRNPSWAPQS